MTIMLIIMLNIMLIIFIMIMIMMLIIIIMIMYIIVIRTSGIHGIVPAVCGLSGSQICSSSQQDNDPSTHGRYAVERGDGDDVDDEGVYDHDDDK